MGADCWAVSDVNQNCREKCSGRHRAFVKECLGVDQLQGLTEITMEDQLCSDPPHRTGFASMGLWYLLSPPHECVTCEGGGVVML